MKLPNYSNVVVPPAKVIDYLLSLDHPDGRSKARFFLRFGFLAEQWQQLAETLRHHAASNDVARTETSPFGTRYVIEGIIPTPDGRAPLIRTIWFIETGREVPRFVTAYPIRRRKR